MKIGVLDSGIGGVAVLKELLKRSNGCEYIYYSDNLNAPYGSLNKDVLAKRALAVTELLIAEGAELVLFLCNTATLVAQSFVSERVAITVLGIAPNMDEASADTLVLATMLTAEQLIKNRKNNAVHILGLRSLSSEIERVAPNFEQLMPYLSALLAPYSGCKKVMTACTHYIHLAPYIRRILPKADIQTGMEGLLLATAEILKQTEGSSEDNRVRFIFSGEEREALYRAILNE